MNTLTSLTPSAIMASGLKRISALTDQHGITSPEVLDACTRWGSILDDVNHPDGTCRYCAEPVTFDSNSQSYVHKGNMGPNCIKRAGTEADPTPNPVTTTPGVEKVTSTRPLLKGK